MMNFVALGLLFSSLAAAGIFSPRPAEPKLYQRQQELHQNDRVVREGHRLLVIEYERQFAVDQAPYCRPGSAIELVEEAKEKFQEAAALLPNVGQGVSMPASADLEEQPNESHPVKNVICDAYGMCKETISSLVSKGKEKTAEVKEGVKDAARRGAEKAGEVKEAAKEVSEDGKEKAAELMKGAKDAVKGAARKAGEKAGRVEEAAKDASKEAKEKVAESMEGAKDAVMGALGKASEVKDEAKDETTNAMGKAVGSAKDKGEEISSGVSSMADKAMDKAEQKKEEVQRNLTDILHRARKVAYDAAAYVLAPEIGRGVAAIMHLAGLSTAYGTSIWVTFVSSHVLAMALPRQQFGAVQSKLYPVYFRAVAYGILLAILGQFFGHGRGEAAGGEKMQRYNLLAALVLVLINMLYFEPKATKVMYKRLKMEKEEGRGREMEDIAAAAAAPDALGTTTGGGAGKKAAAAEQEAVKIRMAMLSKKLKMLNKYSSLLNILTLMSLTLHLVHLSKAGNC